MDRDGPQFTWALALVPVLGGEVLALARAREPHHKRMEFPQGESLQEEAYPATQDKG